MELEPQVTVGPIPLCMLPEAAMTDHTSTPRTDVADSEALA